MILEPLLKLLYRWVITFRHFVDIIVEKVMCISNSQYKI